MAPEVPPMKTREPKNDTAMDRKHALIEWRQVELDGMGWIRGQLHDTTVIISGSKGTAFRMTLRIDACAAS